MAVCIIVSTLAALLLIILAVVAVRTTLFRSKQSQPARPAAPAIEVEAAAHRLSGAVQIPTVSGLDDAMIDFRQFKRFHEYLETSFPLMHSTLAKEVVNEYGLLYTWKGSDTTLKPVLMLAHQDVVPVSEDGWKHPPFSGDIADGYIWGRGTLDDKGSLMGILEAVEHLIGTGFRPSRSIVLAFGFDEEVGGRKGAAKTAELLKSRGQKFEFVIDEGGAATRGMVPGVTDWVALIGTAEKGYLSLELSVESTGGHAAQPPRETAAGIVATAVARLQAKPFPARLTGPATALFSYLGPHMPLAKKMAFANMWLFAPVIKGQLAARPVTDASIRTTTAPTMLSGSAQDNVLPMLATAIINFRLLQGDSIHSVTERVRAVIADPRVRVSPVTKNTFEPSPASPTGSTNFKLLARTIRETLPGTLAAPTLVLARTDSTYFTGLSPDCYRFVPERIPAEELSSIHGINERVSIESYGEMISFYIRLLQNSCT